MAPLCQCHQGHGWRCLVSWKVDQGWQAASLLGIRNLVMAWRGTCHLCGGLCRSGELDLGRVSCCLSSGLSWPCWPWRVLQSRPRGRRRGQRQGQEVVQQPSIMLATSLWLSDVLVAKPPVQHSISVGVGLGDQGFGGLSVSEALHAELFDCFQFSIRSKSKVQKPETVPPRLCPSQNLMPSWFRSVK